MKQRTLLSLAMLLAGCSGESPGPSSSNVGSSGAGGTASGGTAGKNGVSAGSGNDAGNAGDGGATGDAGTGAGGLTQTGGTSAGGTDGVGGIGSGGDSGAGTGGSGGGDNGVVGQPIGFATLNGGTTGGQGGPVVTASTYEQLKSYAESTTPQIVRVEGRISNGPSGGKISVQSNKSLVGVGDRAFLDGVGLEIANSNNIIIQNLRVSLTGVTTRTDTPGVYTSAGSGGLPQVLVNDGDAISISGTSKNIWIDHCEVFSEDPNVQTNKDLYDGLVDIKGQTGFITISFCHFHDHHKGGLIGASDTDLYADRKITFHHNFYDNVKLRVPMYRGATGHFFNNYVAGATDATEIRASTCVRVEKNYYEALHYSIYTPSDSPGSTERIDNVEVSRTSRAYPTDCSADIPYPYAEALTSNTNDVKTIVPQSAGVGKL